ncbi:putative Pre-mRNA-splicing factor ISY1 [Paratrimastix pyriformis]|uniref:Pre-mRNA-splicing factor ISY1 n=1 Tax=Paratrimastix pyriformis TaxID=342808 RepID=A0ABQ8ULX5_9EUKA|nr:putative Pre-mRNA-splicing factor ISY1 [Paratrimastix pyriformis]|eukprot:GAFH01003335.1.p1 GENE.GAFH01003335.1~~GAFH01003335.1.p1  ORF type:complete len:307 (-),score=121.83 GAFH01003335.1:14-934(-)
MARNEEKAMAMLNRFVTMKKEERRGPIQKRPFIPDDCTDLGAAERWGAQVLREINKKTILIQNAGLGENRLRDLNDEINKLLREKQRWDQRIFELGGHKSLLKTEPQKYLYFGAVRQLPGVKELLESEAPPPARRTRGEMYRMIDFEYFGYRDEEDGGLLKAEAKAEKKAVRQSMKEYRKIQAEKARAVGNVGLDIEAPKDRDAEEAEEEEEDEDVDEELAPAPATASHMMDTSILDVDVLGPGAASGLALGKEEEAFVAHVPLPTREELERELVEKKKKILLAKYVTSETAQQQQEAKELLNIRR